MKISNFFKTLGKSVSGNPCTYISICLGITIICCLGLVEIVFEDDPQSLWVDFDGRSYAEQENYNQNYGEYYRINQLIMRPKDENQNIDIFQKNYLMRLLAIENAIEQRRVTLSGQSFNISDVCYAPIPEKGCIVESPLEFWRLNYTMLKSMNESCYDNISCLKFAATCITNLFDDGLPCYSRAGYPVLQDTVFGGTSCIGQNGSATSSCSVCYYQAQALMITYMFENNNFTQNIAMAWELQVFEDVINSVNDGTFSYTDWGVTEDDISGTVPIYITYMAQRSISDEIVGETGANASVIIISYCIMFLYVAIAIGTFPNKVHSGFLLGLGGIVIVLASVGSALGITALFGFQVSLISAEVVPFLILAIGVDNMFIIAGTFARLSKDTDIPTRMGETLKDVGPSITAAAFCECLAFSVGATTNIPALQSFCLTASVAVAFDYIYQLLAFVAFLTLDEKRKKANRLDIVFCQTANRVSEPPEEPRIKKLVDKYYIPVLFSIPCQIIVFIMFFGLIALSMVGYQQLGLGLEQQTSFIEGSPIYNYFIDQTKYGEAGPEGFVIFNNVDFTNPNTTTVIDDLTNDLSRLDCCLVPPIYSWLPSFQTSLDASQQDFPGRAQACNSEARKALPTFEDQLRDFLKIKLTDLCCATYEVCGEQYAEDFVFDDFGKLVSTRFRFFHIPLNTQENFINSFLQTRNIVDQYSAKLPTGSAYAYSLYYVYFEQYTYIKGVALTNILMAVAIVYCAVLILKNAWSALFVFISVVFTTIDILGILFLFNLGSTVDFQVEINAVSVVNMITAVGLSVEFCVHIILKFTKANGTRKERAIKAVSEMGSSVLVGITITKFLGVIVLAFAPTPLFRMYYFRMYLSIVILGSFHGLAFIPILLSYVGPSHRRVKRNNSVLDAKAIHAE